MYWNGIGGAAQAGGAADKLQHEMYWNPEDVQEKYKEYLINYNMRCIEMQQFKRHKPFSDKINYNMRCIEIETEWIPYPFSWR